MTLSYALFPWRTGLGPSPDGESSCRDHEANGKTPVPTQLPRPQHQNSELASVLITITLHRVCKEERPEDFRAVRGGHGRTFGYAVTLPRTRNNISTL